MSAKFLLGAISEDVVAHSQICRISPGEVRRYAM